MLSLPLTAQHDSLAELDSLVKNYMMVEATELLPKIASSSLKKKDKVRYYYLKGILEKFQSNNSASHESLYKGLTLLGPLDISAQAFDFYYYLSVVSRELMHYSASIEYIRKGRKVARKLDNQIFLYESDFLESNAYNAQNKYDSAIHYMTEASSKLDPSNYEQLANIATNIGAMNISAGNFDEALSQFELAEQHISRSESSSLLKLNQLKINKANTYLNLNNYKKCQELMSTAFEEAEANNFKDQLATLLKLRIRYLALTHGANEIPEILNMIGDLEHDLLDSTVHSIATKYNVQFKDTLIADQGKVIRKTEEKLSIESLKAKNRKKGLYLLCLIILGTLTLFYFYTKNQRIAHELELSQEIIQKQTALQAERTRIAAEMHDDLGGGLTTIKFLGQKMLRKIDNIEQKTQLDKIVNNSQTLVSNMSEIIWAMNAGFDTLDNLIAYCRRFASEYLGDHNISLEYQSLEGESQIECSGEKRRHIFLVFKELLHNIVKHAEAQKVNIHWSINDVQVQLTISDNGIGMPDTAEDSDISFGNGLRNMTKRIEQLNGTIHWTNQKGTHTKIELPLSALKIYTT